MYGKTEKEKAISVRQNAIYTATAVYQGKEVSPEEFISFAQRVTDYVSKGQ